MLPQGLLGDFFRVVDEEPLAKRENCCVLSHVTNQAGVDWVIKNLPKGYKVEIIEVNDPNASVNGYGRSSQSASTVCFLKACSVTFFGL
jgi:hypothetical protein